MIDQIWFLYIIRCKNGALYTGITTNIQRRLKEHHQQNNKTAKCLRGKGPFILVFLDIMGSHANALAVEHAIKALSKIEKEKLVLGF